MTTNQLSLMSFVSEATLKWNPTTTIAQRLIPPADAAEFLRSIWPVDLHVQESFVMIYLNTKLRPIGYQELHRGGTSWAPVDVRQVLLASLLSNAGRVIVSHNHPSGELQPSSSDRAITRKLAKGFEAIDIQLADHLILTHEDHYSLKDMAPELFG